MPWQRYVADVGCEIDPDTGLPAYREVMFTVPRQSGKTTISFAWQMDRCLNWGSVQRAGFTMQDGQKAREKFADELYPLLDASPLTRFVRNKTKSAADTAIHLKSGSILRVMPTSESGGHGKTIHQAVLDEIWHDKDDRREAGLRPAMITVDDAQLIVCSTAGTGASVVYNRKRHMGRAAATEDRGDGMAYFEWSAPDGWDPDDEASWWTFMPALGHTISPRAIRAEREQMEDGEFRRAYGNIPTAGDDLIIPGAAWKQVCSPTATVSNPVTFALDVLDDRSSASIAVADPSGVVELVERRPGTGWIVDRCNELSEKYGRAKVALDSGGPAGVFAVDIDHCVPLKGREVIHACGGIYDAIADAKVTFRQHPDLDAAVHGAAKKTFGDNWTWSRKGSTADVTPLMAATLAWHQATGGKPAPTPQVYAWPDDDEIAQWEDTE